MFNAARLNFCSRDRQVAGHKYDEDFQNRLILGPLFRPFDIAWVVEHVKGDPGYYTIL